MKFSLSLNGYIASQEAAAGKAAIRAQLQPQLADLKKLLSGFPGLCANTKFYDGSNVFESIIPLDWICEISITLLRGMPPTGRAGIPDLDNLAKTLCDAIAAPYCPVGVLPIPTQPPIYCITLDDSQIVKITISDDFHWAAKQSDDIAIITVCTKQTDADTAVAFGGANPNVFRKNVQ